MDVVCHQAPADEIQVVLSGRAGKPVQIETSVFCVEKCSLAVVSFLRYMTRHIRDYDSCGIRHKNDQYRPGTIRLGFNPPPS